MGISTLNTERKDPLKEITDLQGTFELHNGIIMPYMGLGVYLSKEGQEVIKAVQWAIEAGYRHIETAAIYGNEEGVGMGIQQSAIDRKDLFVLSKVECLPGL